ncbi:hypothetical protein LSUE1_G004187 [Lachnellula suecica]|uniref:BTB domain-containing protein n=1 Tax=Lachnellula suecica TaxID=602035 RepID=A0A8T9C2K6_9HELO|nr:hypothetical protein LSUE1_G004187 [Lachnellula suecica]
MASSSNPPGPFTFTVPGLESDMRIEVFKQVFLVNSIVLKAASEFFRKFLDSPDKAKASSGAYQYDWITLVDKDGKSWFLTAREKSTHGPQDKPYCGNTREQIEGMKNVLSAIHNWPIEIKNSRQLCLVAELADFYRVLPLMSTALHGVFFGNPELVSSFPDNSAELLEASFRLRNKLLFRECFVHVMGPWSKPRYHNLKEQKLKDLAARAEADLKSRLLEIQLQLVVLSMNSKNTLDYGPGFQAGSEFRDDMITAISQSSLLGKDNKLLLAGYYRCLFQHEYKRFDRGEKAKLLLKPLLGNKLVLDRSGVNAGEGKYSDSFLCFELSDAELPWDVNQRVW